MATQELPLDDSPLLDGRWPPPGRITEEQFVVWCDEDTRAEWVDGEVVMMSPANYEHVALSGWLASLIGLFVEQRDLGKVLQEFQVRLPSARRRRTPDLCFLAKERMHLIRPTHLEGAPDLIFEVVSPDSQARDWREKYLEYEGAGVREYWVIDPMSQRVEAYVLDDADRDNRQGRAHAYRRLEPTDAGISSTVLPGFRLRSEWLWPQTRPKVLDALRELGGLGPSTL